MGLLQRLRQWFAPSPGGAARRPASADTQVLSTQALSTQPALGGGRVVSGEVPDYLELREEIGRGAMAAVHAALNRHTGELVAVKRLLLSAEVSPEELADVHDRFLREAQAAQTLSHPDILKVLDFGRTAAGDAWLVMELVQGHDLSHHTQPGSLLPVRQVLQIGIRLARALHHAHSLGVVHRDVKPANVMIDAASDTVRIMDFGIARMGGASRTRTGLVLGTPSYMSPEQLAGLPVDGRCDLYALGAVLFQLLTGRLPHASESMARLMHEIAHEPVADVRSLRPGLPEALAMVLSLALEKRPELRYASGEDMAQDLEAVLAQLPPEPEEPEAGIRPMKSVAPDAFTSTQRLERQG